MRLTTGGNRHAHARAEPGLETRGKLLVNLVACAADAWAYGYAYIPWQSAQTRHLRDSRSQYAVIETAPSGMSDCDYSATAVIEYNGEAIGGIDHERYIIAYGNERINIFEARQPVAYHRDIDRVGLTRYDETIHISPDIFSQPTAAIVHVRRVIAGIMAHIESGIRTIRVIRLIAPHRTECRHSGAGIKFQYLHRSISYRHRRRHRAYHPVPPLRHRRIPSRFRPSPRLR